MINKLYKIICVEGGKRGYKYPLAILSMAIIESGWGLNSTLAQYNNFFGMKCGGAWKGSSVNLKTLEEYNNTLVSIYDNFRTYKTMQDGVIGFFEFINFSRYSNLKNATSDSDFLVKIWNDGWATDSRYIEKCLNVLEQLKIKIGATEQTTTTNTPSYITEFAKAVIRGEYGNGAERKENICRTIQNEVNKIMGV